MKVSLPSSGPPKSRSPRAVPSTIRQFTVAARRTLDRLRIGMGATTASRLTVMRGASKNTIPGGPGTASTGAGGRTSSSGGGRLTRASAAAACVSVAGASAWRVTAAGTTGGEATGTLARCRPIRMPTSSTSTKAATAARPMSQGLRPRDDRPCAGRGATMGGTAGCGAGSAGRGGTGTATCGSAKGSRRSAAANSAMAGRAARSKERARAIAANRSSSSAGIRPGSRPAAAASSAGRRAKGCTPASIS